MESVSITSTDPTVDPSGPDGEDSVLTLRRGAAIGRYVILDRIGAGGMGVVYAAYDPQLDRKLALKLLRTTSDSRAEARRHRLIREAQAMARLSHRNVITVHDVGTATLGVMPADGLVDVPVRHSQSLVFVAMEFIEGGTLAEWMDGEHSWTDIVSVFVQAGRGLAAAHAAGLVHRDFKPDNVMIADGDRVVVTDFGLARASGARSESPSKQGDAMPEGGSAGSLSTTVTAVGAIMGTPAYMPPEQHEGRPVDERSDQFAFAVALYEALYGERPFPGDDLTSLAYNVGAGNLRPTPSGSAVPSWVRQVLTRALSVDPADRFTSMDDLLSALRREHEATPRRGWLVGGVGVAAAIGVAAGFWLDREPEPCSGANDRMRTVLSKARRTAVRDAWAGADLPYADEAWPSVDAALLDYGKRWTGAWRDACEATHVRGEQSPALLDLRMGCLSRRLQDMDAVVELLATADPQVVQRALSAVQSLTPPRVCDDSDGLLARVPPPDDPEIAGRVENLRPQLARVAALESAGLYGVGLEAAGDLVDLVRDVPYPPLQAEAWYRLASFERSAERFDAAEEHFREAMSFALRGRADDLAAASAAALASVVGQDKERFAEAEGWTLVADAMLARTHAPPDERAQLLRLRARLLDGGGRAGQAVAPLRQALTLLEQTHGPDDARVGDAAGELGRLLHRTGEDAKARPLLQRALEIAEYTLGFDHPTTAELFEALGSTSLTLGDHAAATDALEQALAIREDALGQTGLELVQTLRQLALAHTAAGRTSKASAVLRQAMELARAAGPDAATTVGEVGLELAQLALAQGDAALALTRARSARRSLADALPSSDPRVVAADVAMGRALLALRRGEEALESVARGIAATEAAYGPEAPELAAPLTVEGEARLLASEPQKAIAVLERALRLAEAKGTKIELAQTRLALARALATSPAHQDRAVALARQAKDGFPPARYPALAEAIDMFIETH